MSGSEEKKISKRDRKVNVEYFLGATMNMYDIKPLIQIPCITEWVKYSSEWAIQSSTWWIAWTKEIYWKNVTGNNVVSNLITRTNGNASVAVIKPDEHVHGLELDVIKNGN